MQAEAQVEVVELNPAVDPQRVLSTLREVIDPELGLDVVALGLVYEVHLVGGSVLVVMTLTTPGCPLHATIREDVVQRLGAVSGCEDVEVQLVWDPPWTPERISAEGRAHLFGS